MVYSASAVLTWDARNYFKNARKTQAPRVTSKSFLTYGYNYNIRWKMPGGTRVRASAELHSTRVRFLWKSVKNPDGRWDPQELTNYDVGHAG